MRKFCLTLFLALVLTIPTFAANETTSEHLISNRFIEGGIATGTTGDDVILTYTLPFTFNFYGVNYTTAYVSTNGYISFDANGANDCCYMEVNDTHYPRIYGMGEDLATWHTGEDIFVTANSKSVRFRWKAETFTDGYPVNFEIVLYSNGNIEINYGDNPSNFGIYTMSVGIANGSGLYTTSVYNNLSDLNRLQTSYWGNLVVDKTIKKDKCRAQKPDSPTFIKLEEVEKGSNLSWVQYSADKIDIYIDDGTGKFPWKIEKTSNDGHEFLQNVKSWQKIKIKPRNFCNTGDFSKEISQTNFPNGWYSN